MSAPLDVEAAGRELLAAARTALASRASALQGVAETELHRLAGVLADIAAKYASGEIDAARARSLLEIHRFATRSVLRSIEGLGILAAETAMRAVMGAAGTILNRATGVRLVATEVPDSASAEFKAGKDL